MATKTFAPGTVIDSPWLNDVDQAVYEILGDGVNPATTKAAARTNLGVGLLANGGTGATTAQAAKTNLLIPPAGQCRLDNSGANIIMNRYGGGYLTINGVQEVIPAAGVQLAVTGAVANTSYFIYAFMNAGVMSLEFSVTAPIMDTASGVQIKTGDVTRSLVGQARTTSANEWANTTNQRFILSYYNRRNLIMGPKVFGTLVGIFSNGVYGVLAGTKLEFLSWADETSHFDFSGGMNTNVVNTTKTAFGIDGTISDSYQDTTLSAVAPTLFPVSLSINTSTSTGYHFIDVYSQQNTVATTTYTGSGSIAQRCAVHGFVRG